MSSSNNIIKFSDIFRILIKDSPLRPIPNGYYDKLINGICEEFRVIFEKGIEELKTITNPWKTVALKDLEKEYGLLTNSDLTEDERRKHLNAIVNYRDSNGSASFLQAKLRAAGFDDIYVVENNENLDPDDLLGTYYTICFSDSNHPEYSENAYCNDPNFMPGIWGEGYLLSTGITTPYGAYNSSRFRYIFIIGGSSLGGTLIEDADMEMYEPDSIDVIWISGSGTLLKKTFSIYHSPIRSLEVTNQANLEEQELHPDDTDPSLLLAYRLYDLMQDNNIGSNHDFVQLVPDHDMELAGVTNWQSYGSPYNVSKDTSYELHGYQCLKINYNGTYSKRSSGVKVNVTLEEGVEYIIRCMIRTEFEGGVEAAILNGSVFLTEITNTTGYDFIEVTFVASSPYIYIVNNEALSVSGTFLFVVDNFMIYKTKTEIANDTKMEETGTDNWNKYPTSVDIAKETGSSDVYCGLQSLSICESTTTLNGVSIATSPSNPIVSHSGSPSLSVFEYFSEEFIAESQTLYLIGESSGTDIRAQQKCLEVGRRYKIEGAFKCDASLGGKAIFDEINLFKINEHRIKKINPYQYINDGDCEDSGTSAWTSQNNATLSKDETEQYSGDRCLKIAYTDTDYPGAYQMVWLNAGVYGLNFTAKTEGYSDFTVKFNNITLKSSSDQPDDWTNQKAGYTIQVSTAGQYKLELICDNAGAGWAFFDHIFLCKYNNLLEKELQCDHQLIIDNDMEKSDATAWTATNNAVLTKTTAIKHSGTRSMYITYSGTDYPGAKQSVLKSGQSYHLKGYVSTNGSVQMSIKAGSNVIWTSGIDEEFKEFDLYFKESGTDLEFYIATAGFGSIAIDDLELYELDPVNYDVDDTALSGGTNIVNKLGRALDFNGTSQYCDCNQDGTELWSTEYFSIECIASCESESGQDYIYSNRGLAQINWILYFEDGYIKWRGEAGILSTSPTKFNDGKPHHIVVTSNGDGGAQDFSKLYVDNVLYQSTGGLIYGGGGGQTLIAASPDNYDYLDPIDFYKVKVNYIAIYLETKSAEWISDRYSKYIDILWSGSDEREIKSGFQQISKEISYKGVTLDANIYLNPNKATSDGWTDENQYEFGTIGTGDDPIFGLPSKYSSDEMIKFEGDIFYAAQNSSDFNIATEDFICIFTFKRVNDSFNNVFMKYSSSTAGYNIRLQTGGETLQIQIRQNSTTVVTIETSSLGSLGEHVHIVAAVSPTGGFAKIFANGTSVYNDTFTPLTTISNGQTAYVGNVSNGQIGVIALWYDENLLREVPPDSWFIEQYNKYITSYEPNNWPYAGPYAEQQLDTDLLQVDTTEKGVSSLYNELTLNGRFKKGIISLDAINATDTEWICESTSYELSVTGSGTDPESGKFGQFENSTDKSVEFFDGKYYVSPDSVFGDIDLEDIVIEIVAFFGTTTGIICYKKDGSNQGYIVAYNASSARIEVSFEDIDTATYTLNSDTDSVPNNTWKHILIVIARSASTSDSASNIYINGISEKDTYSDFRVMTSISTSTTFRFGSDGGTEGFDGKIGLLRIFAHYKWLTTAILDSFASSRYSEYTSGGIEYYKDVPLNYYSFGNGEGAIPLLMAKNVETDEWEYISNGKTYKYGETYNEGQSNGGISAIRFYSKFDNTDRSSNNIYSRFDDISAYLTSVDFIEIPEKYRNIFERIVLQTKPLRTWAAMRIRWT